MNIKIKSNLSKFEELSKLFPKGKEDEAPEMEEKVASCDSPEPSASEPQPQEKKELLSIEDIFVIEKEEAPTIALPDKVIFCKAGEEPLDLSELLEGKPYLSYSVDIAITDIRKYNSSIWLIEGALFNEDGRSIKEGVLYFPYSSIAFTDIVFTLAQNIECFGALENYRLSFFLQGGRIKAKVSYLTFSSNRDWLGEWETYREALALPMEVYSFDSLPKLYFYTGRLVGALAAKAREEALEWVKLYSDYHNTSQASADEEKVVSLLMAS